MISDMSCHCRINMSSHRAVLDDIDFAGLVNPNGRGLNAIAVLDAFNAQDWSSQEAHLAFNFVTALVQQSDRPENALKGGITINLRKTVPAILLFGAFFCLFQFLVMGFFAVSDYRARVAIHERGSEEPGETHDFGYIGQGLSALSSIIPTGVKSAFSSFFATEHSSREDVDVMTASWSQLILRQLQMKLVSPLSAAVGQMLTPYGMMEAYKKYYETKDETTQLQDFFNAFLSGCNEDQFRAIVVGTLGPIMYFSYLMTSTVLSEGFSGKKTSFKYASAILLTFVRTVGLFFAYGPILMAAKTQPCIAFYKLVAFDMATMAALRKLMSMFTTEEEKPETKVSQDDLVRLARILKFGGPAALTAGVPPPGAVRGGRVTRPVRSHSRNRHLKGGQVLTRSQAALLELTQKALSTSPEILTHAGAEFKAMITKPALFGGSRGLSGGGFWSDAASFVKRFTYGPYQEVWGACGENGSGWVSTFSKSSLAVAICLVCVYLISASLTPLFGKLITQIIMGLAAIGFDIASHNLRFVISDTLNYLRNSMDSWYAAIFLSKEAAKEFATGQPGAAISLQGLAFSSSYDAAWTAAAHGGVQSMSHSLASGFAALFTNVHFAALVPFLSAIKYICRLLNKIGKRASPTRGGEAEASFTEDEIQEIQAKAAEIATKLKTGLKPSEAAVKQAEADVQEARVHEKETESEEARGPASVKAHKEAAEAVEALLGMRTEAAALANEEVVVAESTGVGELEKARQAAQRAEELRAQAQNALKDALKRAAEAERSARAAAQKARDERDPYFGYGRVKPQSTTGRGYGGYERRRSRSPSRDGDERRRSRSRSRDRDERSRSQGSRERRRSRSRSRSRSRERSRERA